MINVYLTPIERLDEYWPYIEEFMAGAARFTYGRYEAEDIYDLLAGGDHELWVTYEDDETIIGATVTAVYNYARRGWAKIFKNDGYVQKSVYFELPL